MKFDPTLVPFALTPIPASASALLRRHPVFAHLTSLDLAIATSIARVRYYDRKHPIYSQGDPGISLCLMREGQVKLVRVVAQGAESLLWLMQPGALFGAVETGSYSCTAVPTEPISVLGWHRDQLLNRLPSLAVPLGEHSAKRVRELEQRLCEMATQTVPCRLASALLHIQTAAGIIDLSREELAQYAGTTLCTVSRCISKWNRQGLVRLTDKQIQILNQEGLRQAGDGTAMGNGTVIAAKRGVV